MGNVERWIGRTGASALIIGSLYVPSVPWYILGDVKESEIGLWGALTVLGGILCVAEAKAVGSAEAKAVKQVLLVMAALGMIAMLLAQVPAYMSWLMYGGSFTRYWAPNAAVGMTIGLLLHTWLTVMGTVTLITTVKALFGHSSGLKLTRRQSTRTLGILLVLGALWFVWDLFEDKSWVIFTHPVHTATDVPRDVTVSAGWRGDRSNIGMRVRYADEPGKYIPGVTGASMNGVSFKPEQPFEPGKKVAVTVEAGARRYEFYFYTSTR